MIGDYGIGQIIADLDGRKCVIINMTTNSICVHIERKSDQGVNCDQWFTIQDFEKRFKVVKLEW